MHEQNTDWSAGDEIEPKDKQMEFFLSNNKIIIRKKLILEIILDLFFWSKLFTSFDEWSVKNFCVL